MTRLMDRPSTQAIAQARERFARRHRRRRALLGLFTTVVICAALVLCRTRRYGGAALVDYGRRHGSYPGGGRTPAPYSSWNYAPARGDVVVSTVESPRAACWVRRIIGSPGDRVSLDRTTGQVTVNGQPLAEDDVSCLAGGQHGHCGRNPGACGRGVRPGG